MGQYKECEWCGSHLDFGEKCDCQKVAEEAALQESSKENALHFVYGGEKQLRNAV